MDELEAVYRSQSGDQEAFRFLAEQYSRTLLGTAYLLTRDQGLAEDAVQEALIKAWRGLPSFRPGSFRAWLIRILVNHVNQQRRKRGVQTVPLEEVDVPEDGEEVETGLLRKEERTRLNDALESLTPEHKRVVVLRYFAELTVPEISRAIGCREGTVKSRLHRALGQLSQTMSVGEE